MKTKLITLLALTVFVSTYAQWTEQIIQENANGPYSVYTADIDGDGYMDVISCSADGDTVVWHENTNGQGAFETHIIQENVDGAVSVFAADIDGDGDMDVLCAAYFGDILYWFENLDGLGLNWEEHIIQENDDGVTNVHAADIDGDGDIDVLSASEFDSTIAWYENTDGQGSFVRHIIATSQSGPRSVYVADFDDDGDGDVLSASIDGKVAWYKNLDGLGGFGTEIIIATYTDAWRATASDLNGDGYMDVIAVLENYRIDWYENDGEGNFMVHEISTDANGGEWVFAADIDGDGYNDVLCASFFADKISWYENPDGQGSDWVEHIIQEGVDMASSVHAVDINGDGDMDVIATGRSYGKVVWYENTLGLNENTLVEFLVYPSPTMGILTIESKTPITEIEIYNQLGQLVKSNTNQNTIDISSVNQGIYFIKIMDENGDFGTQKVVKN